VTEQNARDQDAQNQRIREEGAALLAAEAAQVASADERNPVLPNMRVNPVGAAGIVLDRFFTKDKLRQLIYYRENWYSYYDKLWSERSEDDVHLFLHNKLLLCRTVDNEDELVDFNCCRANVSEICFQIQNLSSIPSHYKAPCELVKGKWIEIDARGKLVCKGMVIDMVTGKVNSNHALFIPNGANWTYKPKAKPPKKWMTFLEQLFGDKQDEIDLLQEWFGYVLSGDTWAQKGLIVVGPPRAGKGIIGHILSHLLGTSMVSSPALHSLGSTFGLQNLIDKRLCLISDARLSNRQDTMAVIEMLLRLVACDAVDVNRKNKDALQIELGARVMMLSNEMPRLADDSVAINTRFLVLQLSESFLGREDNALKDHLLAELPAIANWAVEGYRRLRERGAFAEPGSSVEARREWYIENNPLSEFIEDACEFKTGERIETGALYAAYKEWTEAHGLNPMPSNAMSRRLATMLGARIRRSKTNGTRFIEGLFLTMNNF
jgi:putative DNA primase/helicase